MTSLRQEAIDPAQYDNLDMDWIAEGSSDSPTRLFIKTILKPYLKDLAGKNILDVGCGVGWLSEVAANQKTKSYTGIDPSAVNIEVAKKLYPSADFLQSTVENYSADKGFDLIICIMATEHMNDIEGVYDGKI
jgi:2-polyprenyl-3-methyl-5-hydroxy-6-metoxy-1,4-benzoquinol methylase